jgi:Sir2 family
MAKKVGKPNNSTRPKSSRGKSPPLARASEKKDASTGKCNKGASTASSNVPKKKRALLVSTQKAPPSNNNRRNKATKQRQSTSIKAEAPFPLYRDVKNVTVSEGLDSIVNLLRGRKNIVVLNGAGISVSCGIPDFRSRGSGLYSTLDTEVRNILSYVHC